MNKKLISKYLLLFSFGSILYMIIEILFRGYTYYTMGITGGVAFILIGMINEKLSSRNMYIELQMLIGSIIVTFIELVLGYLLLHVFNIRMWDYSDQLFNYKGYICPLFSFIWLFISLFAILADDIIRYIGFDEDFPEYRSFFSKLSK